jgi:predicted Fe-S protein YdhL (DUF1289 family)
MEKKKASRAVWSVGAIVVLVAALGLGLGIRKIRMWRAESLPKEDVKPAAKQGESKTKLEAAPLVEAVEEEHVASAGLAGQVQAEAAETAGADVNEAAKTDSVQERSSMAGGPINWRQMWADLNLTPEEMARLREGWRLAMERWQNMSEDERQAEIGRLRGMRIRWESMSDEERQQAIDRGRGRFEEWRRSGQVELPEITLD